MHIFKTKIRAVIHLRMSPYTVYLHKLHNKTESKTIILPSGETPCLNFVFRQNIKTFGIFSWSICNFKKNVFIQ